MFWKKRQSYTFEHERGARHTVKAVDEVQAWKKMRKFLQRMMFGDWAMVYDPVALDEELGKCKIVEGR